ncbi:winged helix-turn-helix transcriptional regulator [Acidithiobacillus sp. CV18-2]|uniref:Winged helix-turn-helix transcriptional regulator n=1 Tax=Igneacidithiobacillus copahuensis TaxID=2724909 RepID=A0AAE3CKT5_9PROT|nr:winged helix-turn-helix transcriptional regulator [Acidithiobacillus sp. CV18-3]MBU2757737.1 winged helix-turn-helix transcriptional regulator [Acidithiobacillus sp. BN09-2]MBU2777392.1 winged helix-turn-helix transcriptional regulator [Acidithiobacillus sp. CV18-2]MBU2789094.1 winged helix-turn-helix transcriptional regulator [Igneacidithiobacillus copahuensis]MBU2796174.1 winged helix-turn-helix transcriptional regulator [Acidithiobacillus sp. VAN18-2]MBU2798515.1 winged helix-turn-helix 
MFSRGTGDTNPSLSRSSFIAMQENNHHRLRLDQASLLGVVGEQRITFSPKEWLLIDYLVAREGIAVSHESLLRALFRNSAGTKNALAVYVLRVNRKLIEANCSQKIESVRSFGYRWT